MTTTTTTTAEIAMLSARGLRGLVWAWQINIVMWRTCDEHVEPGQGTRQSLEIWLFGTRARVKAGLFCCQI
jgi:hypothetical protein